MSFRHHARAAEVARDIGVADWGTQHDSDVFRPRLGVNLGAYIAGYTNQWLHSPDRIGVAVAPGVDEITLAFTADAWARSKRSQVYAVASDQQPLSSRSGLTILPDYASASAEAPQTLALTEALPGQVLERALAGLARRYGHRTAFLVALEFE